MNKEKIRSQKMEITEFLSSSYTLFFTLFLKDRKSLQDGAYVASMLRLIEK